MAMAMNCLKLSGLTTKFLKSSALSNVIVRHSAYDSKLFPGYKVIYSYDSIVNVTLFNKMKLRISYLTALGVPVVKGLEFMNVFGMDVVQGFATIGIAFILYFHGVGYFCNNVIGYIYAKDNSDDIKVSYVNYFGKRKNIDTSIGDIWFPQPSLLDKWSDHLFKTMKIESQNKLLRLSVKGRIIDEDKYSKLRFQS